MNISEEELANHVAKMLAPLTKLTQDLTVDEFRSFGFRDARIYYGESGALKFSVARRGGGDGIHFACEQSLLTHE